MGGGGVEEREFEMGEFFFEEAESLIFGFFDGGFNVNDIRVVTSISPLSTSFTFRESSVTSNFPFSTFSTTFICNMRLPCSTRSMINYTSPLSRLTNATTTWTTTVTLSTGRSINPILLRTSRSLITTLTPSTSVIVGWTGGSFGADSTSSSFVLIWWRV